MQDTNPNLYGMRPPVATQLAGLILEIDHIAIAVENLDEAISGVTPSNNALSRVGD
jgi:hypothetical protein